MSSNRGNKPGYIFCSAETKEELAKRSGSEIPPDNAFVIADVIPYGFCVVATKAEFLAWLFNRDSNHDVWTAPEDKS